MKNATLKRLLSFLVVLSMVLSYGILPVAAETTEDHVHTWVSGICSDETCQMPCGHENVTVADTADCEQAGTKTTTCSTCGTVTATEESAAKGHSYSDGNTSREATCLVKGELEFTCHNCGHTYTEETNFADHTYGEDGICTVADCGAQKESAPVVCDKTAECKAAEGHAEDCLKAIADAEAEKAAEKSETASCDHCTMVEDQHAADCITLCGEAEGCAALTHTQDCPEYDWCAALGCTEETHHADCPWGPCTLNEGCQLVKGHELLGAPCDVRITFDATNITDEASLKAALAEGGEITLGADITVAGEIQVPAGITAVLKLNGKRVTIAESASVDIAGDLTIAGNGCINIDPSAYLAEGYVTRYNGDISAYVVGTLPVAKVESLTTDGLLTLKAGEYDVFSSGLKEGTEDLTLPIALQFTALDDASKAAANAFGNWNTDFYISLTGVEGEINLSGCYLAGHYGDWGWIAIPLEDFTIEGNTVYPVLGAVNPDWFTYYDICAGVQQFKCGIYLTEEVLKHDTLKVNLELRIAPHTIAPHTTDQDDKDSYLKSGKTYTYDVDALKGIVKAPVEIPDDIVDIVVNSSANTTEKAVSSIVSEIKTNAALTAPDYAPNLPENAELVIKLTGMDMNGSTPETISYDVAPMDGDAPAVITEAITFRLPVPASVTQKFADVYHGTEQEHMGIYPVLGSGSAKYVEITSSSFSPYTLAFEDYVACIGETGYSTVKAALEAVEDGQTIELIEGAEGDESGTTMEFDFGKKTFTITGNAPGYVIPTVTFKNAIVNIDDAAFTAKELDARENATINVNNSTIIDKGNAVIKSYYNGAINITGDSVVYTMQVTTMGYITVDDTAQLNASWKTQVYGNGLINVKSGATLATGALFLTGQDYKSRDNTDPERVGKPAAIVVEGTLKAGDVQIETGADYSYNAEKDGIHIGTVGGKSAVLDIRAGGTVTLRQATAGTNNHTYAGKIDLGAGGTVNVNGGTLNVICRNGQDVTLTNAGTINVNGGTLNIPVKLANNGTTNVKGESKLNIGTLTGNAVYVVDDATLTDSTIGGNVYVGFKPNFTDSLELKIAGAFNAVGLYVGDKTISGYYSNGEIHKLTIQDGAELNLNALYVRTTCVATATNATINTGNLYVRGTMTVDGGSMITNTGAGGGTGHWTIYEDDDSSKTASLTLNNAAVNCANYLTVGMNSNECSPADSNAVLTVNGGTLDVKTLYVLAKAGTFDNVAIIKNNAEVTATNVEMYGATLDVALGSGVNATNIKGTGTLLVNGTGFVGGDAESPFGTSNIKTFTGAVSDNHDQLNAEREVVDANTEYVSLTAAVAKVGNEFYFDLLDAVDAADGKTIILMRDILNGGEIATPIKVDLNGNTLQATFTGTLMMNGGTHIDGNGVSMVTSTDDANKANFPYVTDNGVFVIKENGIDILSGEVTMGKSTDTKEGHTVTLKKGATFTVPEEMTLLIRTEGIVEAGATLVTNGTVVLADDATLKAPSGLKVESENAAYKVAYVDGVYQLVKNNSVAVIGGKEYASLDEAIEDAKAGETIKLVDNVTESEIEISKDITVDMNGSKLNGVITNTAADATVKVDIEGSNGVTVELGVNDKVSVSESGAMVVTPFFEDTNKGYGTVKITVPGASKPVATTYFMEKGGYINVSATGSIDADNSVDGKKIKYLKEINDKDEKPALTTWTEQDGEIYEFTHVRHKDGHMLVACDGFYSACVKVWISGPDKYNLPVFKNGSNQTSYITVADGSTKVTLDKHYLNKLDDGTYTVHFQYEDGQIKTHNFKVTTKYTAVADTTNPKTGDSILMAVATMNVSAAALFVLMTAQKKRSV